MIEREYLGDFDKHKVFPLIVSKKIFITHILAAKTVHGQGSVIIMNAQTSDIALLQLMNHLLEIVGPIRNNQIAAIENELKAHLPSIIEETFEVFDEIPLQVIMQKNRVTRHGN